MIKNLKKVISTFAAVAMLATSASAFAVSFPDVDANASYSGAVDALTSLGVVNGDDNGKFNPENTVTRAEFAKMVVEMLGEGKSAAASTYTKFVDAQGHWGAGYIETGVAKGFINGYDDTTFGPDDQVTYAQAVKMLVSAVGYDLYATEQGGYPSGYLAYGSSLDIIDGVTGVTNDTALTRAQCAILIYNALKAPICAISHYNQNYQGEWYPVYTKYDGVSAAWKSALTEYHNAYVAMGRVTDVTRDAKRGDRVTFAIEKCDNFDGNLNYTGSQNAYVGNSKADETLYNYSEAIIQKDKSTKEFTIVSVTPYGSSEIVEFAMKDVKTLPTASLISVKNGTKTDDYDIASDACLYINGAKQNDTAVTTYGSYGDYINGGATNTVLDNAYNQVGKITLINKTDVASTAVTDDEYDYVMVDYYATSKVDAVDVYDDEVEITVSEINAGFGLDGTITIDLDDETSQTIKFYKNGEEISYKDVKKKDIVSIAVAPGGNWYEKDLEIYVSDSKVSGTISSKNESKKTVTVDGTTYDYAIVSGAGLETGKDLTLYLDAFGYVVKRDVNSSSAKYGVVVDYYTQGSTAYVSVVTADGKIEKYATNENFSGAIVTDSTSASNVAGKVIEYKIDKNDYLKTVSSTMNATAKTNAEYSEELSLLGGYSISETATKIVDISKYTADKKVSTMTFAQLEDEGKYDVVAVSDVNDDDVPFIIVTTDGTALKATSTLAVIQATGATATADDDTSCDIITLAVNGEKNVEVYFDATLNADNLAEGTVIMYKVGSEGYVESASDYKVIFTPNNTYNDMKSAVFANSVTNFTAVAGGAVVAKTGVANEYTLNVNGQDADVDVYYGPVYTATDSSLRVFTSKSDSTQKSNFVSDTKALSIGNANVYTYNYSKDAGDNQRVSTSRLSQERDFFGDSNTSEFTWSSMGSLQPRMAFVRVDDNVVTDVVYYRAR